MWALSWSAMCCWLLRIGVVRRDVDILCALLRRQEKARTIAHPATTVQTVVSRTCTWTGCDCSQHSVCDHSCMATRQEEQHLVDPEGSIRVG